MSEYYFGAVTIATSQYQAEGDNYAGVIPFPLLILVFIMAMHVCLLVLGFTILKGRFFFKRSPTLPTGGKITYFCTQFSLFWILNRIQHMTFSYYAHAVLCLTFT